MVQEERQLRRFRWRGAPIRRFVVAEASMEPTLVEGQGLVATPWGRPRVGQIRVLEHPMRPGFWLVKRIEAIDGDTMLVRSDNRDAPGARDSSDFGPVSVSGSYRVVFAVPRRWM